MLFFTPLFLLSYSRDSFMFLLFCGLAVIAFLLLGAASVKNKITRNAYFAKMNAIKTGAASDVVQMVKEYRAFFSAPELNFNPQTRKRLREAIERQRADPANSPLTLLDSEPVNNDTLLLLLSCKHDVPYIPNGGETFSVTHVYYHFCTLQLQIDKDKLVLNVEPSFYTGSYPADYTQHLQLHVNRLLELLLHDAMPKNGISV